jgi:hypothetical protein
MVLGSQGVNKMTGFDGNFTVKFGFDRSADWHQPTSETGFSKPGFHATALVDGMG